MLRGKVSQTVAEFAGQAETLGTIADTRFAALADRSAAFREQLDLHEQEALAAIRNRAQALTAELEQTRRLLDGHEEESLVSLRARLTALRDEGATISRALRDGETGALAAWRAALARMDSDMREAIETLETVDRTAMEGARQRLAALSDEAAMLDAGLAERNRQFDAEVVLRQHEAEQREAAAADRLRERIAAIEHTMSAHRAAQEVHANAFADHADALGRRLEGFAARMRDIAAQGGAAEAAIAASLQTLADKLVASREALDGTDGQIAGLTDSSAG